MRNYRRIAMIYWVVGALWILLSDRLLEILAPEHVVSVQTFKGWFFVGFTGLLLWGLLKRREERQAATYAALVAAQSRTRDTVLFVATTTHELRTPLSAILGFTGYLLQEESGSLSAEQREQLTAVRDSGNHLKQLVDDIAMLTRLDAGAASPHVSEFPVGDLLSEAADVVRAEAALKGLELDVASPPGLTVNQDRRRLLQCLLNLLSNAVKYTERGSVTLTASASGDDLVVEVADTGPGIPPEARELVFRPYSRLDTDNTRRTAGTGLGLFITRRLTESLLGGSLDLDDAPSGGCRFRLRVPAGLDG